MVYINILGFISKFVEYCDDFDKVVKEVFNVIWVCNLFLVMIGCVCL